MPPYFVENPSRIGKQIDFMIQGHQIIVDLLSTPNLEDLLERLSNQDQRNAISADPLKAARDANVNLPEEGVSIKIFQFGDNWQVEVQVEIEDSVLVVGFNSRKGFFSF